MITYEFENGHKQEFKSLGWALEYAHRNNTRIKREY